MAKKKSNTTQNQSFNNTASYGQITPNDTEDIKAFRDYRPEIDPTIAHAAGAAKNRLNSSFINPLGGYQTAQNRDAMLRAGNRQIDQDASQQFRQGQYDVNQMRSGQLGSLAALTAPRIVQTGSSGNSQGMSNTTQGNNLFGDIMSLGMGGAQMALA